MNALFSARLVLPTLAAVALMAPLADADDRYRDAVVDDTDGRVAERSAEMDRAGAYGPREGVWEVTLSGTGNSDKNFDSNTVGVSVDASHYFSELLSGGVRQTVSATGDKDNNAWSGATSAFGQVHFGEAKVRPYLGVELGYLYGDGVNDTFFGGPEAGVRYYIKDEAFLFGRASYQFLFDNGNDAVDRFDDGRFVYTFGVGFNW